VLFVEPVGLLLSSQDRATGPDIEVYEFSPQTIPLKFPCLFITQDVLSPFTDIL
jgi:hypothetical protein